MTALINELVQYLIKFLAMLVCAFAGICVGKVLRKKKDEKLASENTNE
ncbi:MAG: hypothetical protein ACI4D8_02585 [Wujia sp.]